jgi:hypothetical protein
MGTSATTEAKALPQFSTITITDQTPEPHGKVEVTPNAGRILFQNNDPVEYRIRFYKPDADPNAGGSIDLLLPAKGFLTLLIRKDDAFSYSVMAPHSENAMTGKGGGPATN